MAFTKQEIEYFDFGADPTENGLWSNLNANHNELYENVSQPVLFSILDMATSDADTSFHTYLKWMLEKNTDNQNVLVYIRAKRTGGTGTVVFKAHVGSINNATSLTSAVGTSYQDITITLAPSGTDTSREMYLEVKTSDTGTKAIIDSISVYTVPSAPAVGTTTCGFSNMPTGAYAANEAISTERLSRIIEGPVQVTKDRPSCVYSFLDNLHTPRSFYTTSTTFESVLNVQVPFPDKIPRDYILYAYLTSNNTSSGVPHARIVVNGKQVGADVSGIGWKTFYINDLANDLASFERGMINIQMKEGSGSYQAVLGSLQVIRNPVAS